MIIAVCASNESLLRATADVVRGGRAWAVTTVERRGVLEATMRVGARALVVGLDAGDRALEAEIVRVQGELAVVTLGPSPSWCAPVCAFPRWPTAALLGAVLAELVDDEHHPRSGLRDEALIGVSGEMETLRAAVDRVARSDVLVLITGEAGTGKGLVARALHRRGRRAHRPWVELRCSSLPAAALAVELFGCERGAAVGATEMRLGAFEVADGGTLFLDEISALPLALQGRLLRVLETGEVTRVGSSVPRPIDVRVVVATERPLEDEVAAGSFQEDLRFRLSACALQVPPLRGRPDDVAPLAAHLLARRTRREGRDAPAFGRSALERLVTHSFPGNGRELEAVLERALLLCGAGPIEAEHVLFGEAPAGESYPRAKAEFDARYYSHLLRATGGNVSLVARLAGKGRKDVYAMLRRLGLDPADFRLDAADRSRKSSGTRAAVRDLLDEDAENDETG